MKIRKATIALALTTASAVIVSMFPSVAHAALTEAEGYNTCPYGRYVTATSRAAQYAWAEAGGRTNSLGGAVSNGPFVAVARSYQQSASWEVEGVWELLPGWGPGCAIV